MTSRDGTVLEDQQKPLILHHTDSAEAPNGHAMSYTTSAREQQQQHREDGSYAQQKGKGNPSVISIKQDSLYSVAGGGEDDGERETSRSRGLSNLCQMEVEGNKSQSVVANIADPSAEIDLIARGRRKRPFLTRPYMFFHSVPMQVILFLLLLVDAAFLLYEFISGSYRFSVVTVVTSTIFLVEVVIATIFEGRRRFKLPGSYWLIAELVIIIFTTILEYLAFIIIHTSLRDIEPLVKTIVYLRAIRIFRVIILAKVRFRRFTSALRQFVSADRRRYRFDGYDLDLTFITPRIIAMSWPANSTEGFYRNPIDTVAHFFNSKYNSAYRVYNLCSERRYDESKFNYSVTCTPMDDHNPAELGLMLKFVQDVHDYLEGDSRRVAAVHCKGGKGRTGTMTCAYLMYSSFSKTADEALKYFGERRTSDSAKSFQGVESPSQNRYVHYFERVLRNMKHGTPIPSRPVRITKIVFNGVPAAWWRTTPQDSRTMATPIADIARAAAAVASPTLKRKKDNNTNDFTAATEAMAQGRGGNTGGLESLWFAIITHPCSSRDVEFLSNPSVTFDPVGRSAYGQQPGSEAMIAATGGEGLPASNSSSLRKGPKRATDVTILNNGSQVNRRRQQAEEDTDDDDAGESTGTSYLNNNRTMDSATTRGCAPEKSTFKVYVNHDWKHPMSIEDFESRYATTQAVSPTTPAMKTTSAAPPAHVAVELTNPEDIPVVDGDVVFKFFFAQDNPNALKSPLLFWFHTAFEGKEVRLLKQDVDGPHKSSSTIGKQLPSDFYISITLADA